MSVWKVPLQGPTAHTAKFSVTFQKAAKDFRWKSVLLIYVFRALSLRVAFLEEHAHIPWDADLDNDMDRKALNDLALLWTSRYLTTSAASRGTARSVLRVFWTDWFGHKDFALLIATKHVLDWQMTLTLLTEHLQHLGLYCDSCCFRHVLHRAYCAASGLIGLTTKMFFGLAVDPASSDKNTLAKTSTVVTARDRRRKKKAGRNLCGVCF